MISQILHPTYDYTHHGPPAKGQECMTQSLEAFLSIELILTKQTSLGTENKQRDR